MPERHCRTKATDHRKKYRCRICFFPASRHLHMIFRHLITRITPSAEVFCRAGCIFVPLPAVWTCTATRDPFHHHKTPAVWTCRVLVNMARAFQALYIIPFHRQQYGRLDVQGVSPCKASSMGVQCVSLSIASSMVVQGVSISTASIVW